MVRALDPAPHHIVTSQDFQNREIPDQETKVKASHLQWIRMKTGNKNRQSPEGDPGGEESD